MKQIEKKVECKKCNGDGFTAEHENHPMDVECVNCPIQVQCDDCKATGYITIKDLEV